jgi:hypothetical protein
LVGDFNGDGKTDIAILNVEASNSISILLGNGDGTFTRLANFSDSVGGQIPISFAVADVNGDGIDDLVVTHNDVNSTVHILLGNGDGTFTLSPNQLTLGGGNYNVSTGDFNGDGNIDLAFFPSNDGSSIIIFLGGGTGGFTPGSTVTIPSGIQAYDIGDFNGDGTLDLAILTNQPVPPDYYRYALETLLGKGDGTFPKTTEPTVVGQLYALALGDFNGDGLPDLALLSADPFVPTGIALGNGDGTFSQGAIPAPSAGGGDGVVGNFDQYGRSGLVLPNVQVVDSTTEISGNFIVLPALASTASVTGISIPQFTGGHYVYADYSGDTNYTSSISATVGLSPVKTVPSVSWATPAPIVYGTALGVTQLNATSTIAGTFTYSPALGTYPSAGAQTLTVTFHPSDTFDYSTATATVVINVSQAAPSLAWTTPAAITYGVPLSSTQLNAVATGVGPNSGVALPGIFTYAPAAGATPAAGQDTLSGTFTPTDSTDYTTAAATVSLTVNKATPAISWVPAAISYGAGLGINQLDATAAGLGALASTSVPGAFSYSPSSGTVLTAGSQTLSVTFTPADTADYNTATGTATLTVNKATPVISWPQPAAISYGTALSTTQLDASATGLGAYVTTAVPGAFVYSPLAGTVLTAGTQALSTTFTPADTNDYNTATGATSLTVNKVAITVNCATPAAISYGTALSSSQFACSTSPTIPGSFTYSPASGTALSAGTHTITAAFTPTDTTDYITATGTFAVTVNPAKPTIAWATPAAITYGGALGATQLDAASPVAGTFAYSPALGTMLTAGTQLLSVTFTPSDTADYTTAAASVSLTVKQAAPSITWHLPAAISSGTPLSSTELNATAAFAGSPLAGTFTYTPAIGSVPAVGTDTLSVTFAPADTIDYLGGTATVKETVYASATMISPAAGSVLPGSSVSFNWTAATGATGYYLWIGSTGVGSNNIYNSAEKTVTSYTFPYMPTNGETIYVRLSTNYNGTWVSDYYTYTAYHAPAAMLSPAQGSTFSGSSVTFNWTAEPGATGYYLWIGSTGVGSNDIYNSAEKTVTSYTFTQMPTNGETIFVRLSTNYNGIWASNYYTYTAAAHAAASMTSPTSGTTFAGSSVTFNWAAEPGATGYYLWIGSTGANSNNIYNSAEKTVTSYTFTQMPTNGETVYVRLSTNYNGTWVSNYYTYTAAP